MSTTTTPETTATTAPVEAPTPVKNDNDPDWEAIKAEARAKGVERGHRTEAELKPEPKPEKAAKPEPKEPKSDKVEKAKTDEKPSAARDDKGRFAPKDGAATTSPDKPAEKAEKTAKPEAKPAEPEPKPPEAEAEAEKPKRPQRTDAEINASFARLKRERREVESARAEVTRARQEHETWQREQASDRELRDKDPYGWLEKHGFDLVDVARETKRRSEMTPVERESSDLKRELAGLKATIEELKKSPPAAAKSAELHELPEAQPFIERASTAHGVLSPSDYPLLSQEESGEVGRASLHIDHEHWRRTGKHLDLRSIFRILEGNLQKDSPQPASAAPNEEAGTAGAIRTESENGGPKDTGNRPPAVNHSLSARTAANIKPERGSREAAIRRLAELQRS